MNQDSIWLSLKNKKFRTLWLVTLISGSAVVAYNTAAVWLMNALESSSFFLSLIPVATSLAFFLFTLPAGIIADLMNRTKAVALINLGYGYPRTSPVGSFLSNKYGLCDMGGNVWQCCEDWYNPEKVFRVLRGASWYDCDPQRIIASFRRLQTPDRRGADAGFRCVLSRESSR